MKKNIGAVNAAFPTPIVVVGAMCDNQPNWFEVAWIGIGDGDVITLSVTATHKTCEGIRATGLVSIALVNDKILQRADYVGVVSGEKVDKSHVFEWYAGDCGAPVIEDADVVMECRIEDIYDKNGHYLFFCKVVNTYADEQFINAKGKLDYNKLKPILFEPSFNYLRTGELIGPCVVMGKKMAAGNQ